MARHLVALNATVRWEDVGQRMFGTCTELGGWFSQSFCLRLQAEGKLIGIVRLEKRWEECFIKTVNVKLLEIQIHLNF